MAIRTMGPSGQYETGLDAAGAALPELLAPAGGLDQMLAAIAAGADGVMIEVHNDPPKALCDGAQSLRPDQFAELMQKVKKLSAFMKTL